MLELLYLIFRDVTDAVVSETSCTVNFWSLSYFYGYYSNLHTIILIFNIWKYDFDFIIKQNFLLPCGLNGWST